MTDNSAVLTVSLLDAELSRLWPASLSAPWDNDGIMCAADPDAPVARAVVSLDATLPAIEYAAGSGAALVTHHPMIFRGIGSVVGGEPISERVIAALRGGVAVLSYHTRLDAARGGVNDALSDLIGIDASTVEPFGDEETPTLGRIGRLYSAPLTADAFAKQIASALGAPAVRVTGDGTVSRVAVVGGSGGDLVGAAIRAGADAFVTGEIGYNKAEDAAEQGKITVFEAGHYHTEAPVTARIADALTSLGIETEIFDSCPQRVIIK